LRRRCEGGTKHVIKTKRAIKRPRKYEDIDTEKPLNATQLMGMEEEEKQRQRFRNGKLRRKLGWT